MTRSWYAETLRLPWALIEPGRRYANSSFCADAQPPATLLRAGKQRFRWSFYPGYTDEARLNHGRCHVRPLRDAEVRGSTAAPPA